MERTLEQSLIRAALAWARDERRLRDHADLMRRELPFVCGTGAFNMEMDHLDIARDCDRTEQELLDISEKFMKES